MRFQFMKRLGNTGTIMLDLNNKNLLKTEAYIDGQWVSSDKKTAVVNPATGDKIADVTDLSADHARLAIEAAYKAQKEWREKTALERCNVLLKWHDLLLENQEDLAQIITAEMGKPVKEARGEIGYGASFIRWFAEEARRIYGDTIPGHMPDKRLMVLKQPIGVAASITPWNFPNAMITRKVAPALAAGCTFVARPSELTPLSALALAELGEQAGIPAGVFNVVPGVDAAAIGLELCTNKMVRKLSFTGSTRVGSLLMEQSAESVKKLSLELGGNAPFIVFDDADIDKAVEGLLIAKFRNSGQTCVCANRIYVQEGIYDEFADKLSQAVLGLKTGDGRDESTHIGPLINDAGLKKVETQLADAVSKGASVKTGGERLAPDQLFFPPTVITNISNDMQFTHEETFGPLAPLYKFTTEKQVIALANDTDFGLASYFYSNDLSRVWKVMEGLEYGMVGVNTGLISTTEAPFGGIKHSGLGREGSHYGLDEYLELKYVCLSV